MLQSVHPQSPAYVTLDLDFHVSRFQTRTTRKDLVSQAHSHSNVAGALDVVIAIIEP